MSPNVPQSEYRAVEIESGRQMDVQIRIWKKYGKDSNYRFVVGSEKNRKLYCPDCPLFIKGLDVQAPPESDTSTISYDPVFSNDITSDDSVLSKDNLGEEEETAWTKTFREINVTVHSTTYTLCSFWKHPVKELFPEQASQAVEILEEPRIMDWFLPPNTRAFMINTSAYLHEVFQHLLYMRIKRESRYWATDLWNDIIGETKQVLDSIDDDHRLACDGIVQKVGKGNPLVMLVVGRDVRVFEWHEAQTADSCGSLCPLESGKTYSTINVEQRKTIELVLRSTMLKLDTTKAKKEHLMSRTVAQHLANKGYKIPAGRIVDD